MRDLDARLARHLILKRIPTQKNSFSKFLGFAQQRWQSSRNFCARGAPKFFENFASFFARVGRKVCVVPTLDAFLFSELNAMLNRSNLCDVVQYAQRTLAECIQFLCAGRAGFSEILQNFRPIVARTVCVLDAELARNRSLERIPTQKRFALKFCGFRNNAGRLHAVLCARRPEFFRKLRIFFARFGRKICVIPTLDARFFGSRCNSDSINSHRRCAVCAAHAG